MRVACLGRACLCDTLNSGPDITNITGLSVAGAMESHGEIEWIARSGVLRAYRIGDAPDIR